jgi:nucleotide-binding universal stress UspA family protein
MSAPAFPDAVVVAVDFSPCSLRALDTVLSWRRAETEITILHVIDRNLAQRIERAGLLSYAEATEKMHRHAEGEFGWLRNERPQAAFESMIVEGIPFVEIVKIATDLECSLIAMGSRGTASGVAEFLFGSTAEKVLRGARQPVLCVP